MGSVRERERESVLLKNLIKVIADFDVIDFLFFGVVHPTGSNQMVSPHHSIQKTSIEKKKLSDNGIENVSFDLLKISIVGIDL